jgi:hypothetical protein
VWRHYKPKPKPSWAARLGDVQGSFLIFLTLWLLTTQQHFDTKTVLIEKTTEEIKEMAAGRA